MINLPPALMSPRFWTVFGAITCGSGVALGAYGWHGLGGDTEAQDVFMLAVQYQMWHGLALFAVAWRCDVTGSATGLSAIAGLSFLVGIFLFSVNLYHFAIVGEVLISGAAPLGGFALIAGWALLGLSVIRRP